QPSCGLGYLPVVSQRPRPPRNEVINFFCCSAFSKGPIMRTILATTLMLLTGLTAQANVTVNGEGKVTAVPTVGHILLGVVSEGKTAAEALAANSAAMKALFQTLASLGIADRDVQTTSVTLNPKYRQIKDHEPELVGYTASHQISVKVRK